MAFVCRSDPINRTVKNISCEDYHRNTIHVQSFTKLQLIRVLPRDTHGRVQDNGYRWQLNSFQNLDNFLFRSLAWRCVYTASKFQQLYLGPLSKVIGFRFELPVAVKNLWLSKRTFPRGHPLCASQTFLVLCFLESCLKSIRALQFGSSSVSWLKRNFALQNSMKQCKALQLFRQGTNQKDKTKQKQATTLPFPCTKLLLKVFEVRFRQVWAEPGSRHQGQWFLLWHGFVSSLCLENSHRTLSEHAGMVCGRKLGLGILLTISGTRDQNKRVGTQVRDDGVGVWVRPGR